MIATVRGTVIIAEAREQMPNGGVSPRRIRFGAAQCRRERGEAGPHREAAGEHFDPLDVGQTRGESRLGFELEGLEAYLALTSSGLVRLHPELLDPVAQLFHCCQESVDLSR